MADTNTNWTLEQVRELDARDPLGSRRDLFAVPDGIVYLDGNSLGALPRATPGRVARVIEEEWGKGLIRSWNRAGWMDMPTRAGGKIAKLIGAEPDEVITADSTSVNLFKLVTAALRMRPGAKRSSPRPAIFPPICM